MLDAGRFKDGSVFRGSTPERSTTSARSSANLRRRISPSRVSAVEAGLTAFAAFLATAPNSGSEGSSCRAHRVKRYCSTSLNSLLHLAQAGTVHRWTVSGVLGGYQLPANT